MFRAIKAFIERRRAVRRTVEESFAQHQAGYLYATRRLKAGAEPAILHRAFCSQLAYDKGVRKALEDSGYKP